MSHCLSTTPITDTIAMSAGNRTCQIQTVFNRHISITVHQSEHSTNMSILTCDCSFKIAIANCSSTIKRSRRNTTSLVSFRFYTAIFHITIFNNSTGQYTGSNSRNTVTTFNCTIVHITMFYFTAFGYTCQNTSIITTNNSRINNAQIFNCSILYFSEKSHNTRTGVIDFQSFDNMILTIKCTGERGCLRT